MSKLQFKWIIPLCIYFISTALTGCTGLRIGRMGRYYKTELAPNYKNVHIKKIGVYVFSNGRAKDGTQPPLFRKILFVLSLGIINDINVDSFDQRFFPPEIKAGSKFHPSPDLKDASHQLAMQVAAYLTNKGYSVQLENLPDGMKKPMVYDCISDAAKKGFDAVFIVDYTGMYRWVKFKGSDSYSTGSASFTVNSYDEYTGFLYLPNAAMFDIKTGKRVWASSYYGLVQGAHLFNFLAPYNVTSAVAVVNQGGSNSQNAAENAAKMIFKPKYWPGSFVDLPQVGQ